MTLVLDPSRKVVIQPTLRKSNRQRIKGKLDGFDRWRQLVREIGDAKEGNYILDYTGHYMQWFIGRIDTPSSCFVVNDVNSHKEACCGVNSTVARTAVTGGGTDRFLFLRLTVHRPSGSFGGHHLRQSDATNLICF